MFPTGDLVARSRQLARKMVGTNELNLARENAMQVFTKHGGAFDADSAPIPGHCQLIDCRERWRTCDEQHLALAVLLSLSVFETAQEQLVEQTVQRVKDEIIALIGVTE
jgi:hypothetical protein